MNLNKQQTAAVTTDGKRVLVVAGPGSGKTRVIVERVARLVRGGYSGHDIMLVTFTRKAAEEMKSRITERIGEVETRKIWCGTFHSICLRMLREWGERLDYRPDTLSIYDDADQRDLLDDVIEQLRVKVKRAALEQIVLDYGTVGAGSLETHEAQHPTECKVFRHYRMRLRENNALDYGLILTEAHRLLSWNTDILDHYRAKFKHILIDEYQDTDRLQAEIVRMLAPENLFVVGDSDQAIYSFRGATLQVLLDFQTEHFDAEVIELPACYRCARQIVDAANRLIRHNAKRIAKEIVAVRDCSGKVSYRPVEDQPGEAIYYAGFVAASQSIKVADVAFLSRTKAALNPIADALDAADVKYLFVGREASLFTMPVVKQFVSFLTLAVNPKDNLAFLRIRKVIGIDDDAYMRIRQRAVSNEMSHLEAAEAMTGDPLFTAAEREVNGDDLMKWCGTVATAPKFSAPPEIAALLKIAGQGHKDGRWATIYDFLMWIQQRDLQDDLLPEDTPGVKLMTCHAAKGLEFDTVCIVGCYEGHMPHSRAKTDDDIEEERRLMYVAITRAKDTVVVTTPAQVSGWNGQPRTVNPSRFISEMGEQ